VTNARFASLHGLSVVPVPLSTTPVPLRKPRARHERASAMGRISGGLPSAARWRRCAPASFQPSLRLRSTVSARRPQTEASESAFAGKVMNSPISDWPMSDFPITDCKIASHSSCRRDSAMKPRSIVWRRRSLQDTTGRSLKRSRFRSSLTRPPPPGSFASRFSSRETCLLERRFNWFAAILRCYFFAFLR
jgi:hypothetical protein